MRTFTGFLLVSATVVSVASAYGFKYSRNPYSGECRLLLNLPGGKEQTAYKPGVGQKDYYPGIMNTRYGTNDGKYHANHHHSGGGGSYHGAASSQHSHLASGANNYGSGSGFSQSSSTNNRVAGNENNYAGGSGRFPSSSAGSSSSGGFQSSGGNYGSSGNNYESSGSSSTNYGSSGNYGGGSGYGNGGASTGSFGSSSTNYESSSDVFQGTRGSGNAVSTSNSNNYRPANPVVLDRDRNTGSYGSSSSNIDRDVSSYGSSSSSSQSNGYDRDAVNYGSGNNRETSNSYDRDTVGYPSSNNRGSSSSYDRDIGNNRESTSFESSNNNYGSSSSGNRESSSSSEIQGTRYGSSSSSSGSRGSGASYGGGSSLESYGESGQDSIASSGSTSYTNRDGTRNRESGSSSFASAGATYNGNNEYDNGGGKRRVSGSSASASAFSSSSAEQFGSGERNRETSFPIIRPTESFEGGESYHKEVSRKKVVSSSSSSSQTETKKTTVTRGPSSSHNGDFEGQGTRQFAAIDYVPSEFEDCGVYEYYSKRFRKCVKIGSPEDEQLEREKESTIGQVGESESSNRRYSSNDGVSTSTFAGPNGASSSASSNRGGGGSVSSYSSSHGGQSSSGARVQDEYGNNVKNTHVHYNRNNNYDIGGGSGSYFGSNGYWDRQFARDVLSAHNVYRARHDTPPVTLDEKISKKAQEWANELALGHVTYGHSPDAVDGVYGESLQVMNVVDPTGTEVIDHWYEERKNYDYKNPNLTKSPRSRRNSHFTAIIWKATRKIGVGKATSNDGRSFIVVSYWPPGNIVDVLEDNVLPPRPGLSSREREPIF